MKRRGSQALLVVPSDRTGDSGHKLKHSRFPLNIRKQFFTLRWTEHSHDFLRGVLESPFMEILKRWLDTVLSKV